MTKCKSVLHESLENCCMKSLATKWKKKDYFQLWALPECILENVFHYWVNELNIKDDRLAMFFVPKMTRLVLVNCTKIKSCLLRSISYYCPLLTVLDVSNCVQVRNNVIRPILQKCPKLKVLKMANCSRITDAVFDQSLFYPSRACVSLQWLDVSGCTQITSDTLFYLIKTCHQLKHIQLSRIKRISDHGIQNLLQASMHLEKVDLSFMGFSPSVFDVPKGLHISETLTEICLNGCKGITNAALYQLGKVCTSLTSISLAYCANITDIGMESLLVQGTQLQFLNVQSCALLTDATAYSIAQYCTSLQHLNISYCTITDIGLAQMTKNCPLLHTLTILYCEYLSSASIIAIAGHLSNVRHIQMEESRNLHDTQCFRDNGISIGPNVCLPIER